MCAFALTSCDDDSFKIEGVLTDLGENAVTAVYVNEAGVQSVRVPNKGGRFDIVGVSANYTMVQLYGRENILITKVLMKNGDKLQLKGTMKHNYLIEMKGSDENEDWNNFRRENHVLYSEKNTELLNEKIEKYIVENPSKLSSLALLLYDYSSLDSVAHVREMLNTIDEKSRPASLLNAYADINAQRSDKVDNKRKWHSLDFYNENDSIESFMPLKGKMSLLYFWERDNDNHSAVITKLDSLYYNYMKTPKGKTQLQIADVTLYSDTISWKRTLRNYDKDWKHYWAVGGVMNSTVNDLLVTSAPHFLLLDSVGSTLYRGVSIEEPISIIESRLVKMSDKDKALERDKKKKKTEKKKEDKRKARERRFKGVSNKKQKI